MHDVKIGEPDVRSVGEQYDIGEFAKKYSLLPEDACRIIDYAGSDRERAEFEACRVTYRMGLAAKMFRKAA